MSAICFISSSHYSENVLISKDSLGLKSEEVGVTAELKFIIAWKTNCFRNPTEDYPRTMMLVSLRSEVRKSLWIIFGKTALLLTYKKKLNSV